MTFANTVSVPSSGGGAQITQLAGVFIQDVNSDGIPDILVANSGASDMAVLG